MNALKSLLLKSGLSNNAGVVKYFLSALTRAEAAEYLRVSTWTIRKLVAEGKLPVVSSGRGFLIDVRDLDDYIEQAKARRKPPS